MLSLPSNALCSLDLDYDKEYKASWVVYPNSNFDPKVGLSLQHLSMNWRWAKSLAKAFVNEHHQNAYGLMPSPIVPASALARRTSKRSAVPRTLSASVSIR